MVRREDPVAAARWRARGSGEVGRSFDLVGMNNPRSEAPQVGRELADRNAVPAGADLDLVDVESKGPGVRRRAAREVAAAGFREKDDGGLLAQAREGRYRKGLRSAHNTGVEDVYDHA